MMSDIRIHVTRMAECDQDVRYHVADVFVDAYYKELSHFTKERERLRNALQSSFCPDVFYVAEMEGEIVGILACSHNRQRAMQLNKADLKKHFGFAMGTLAYYVMRMDMNAPLRYPNDTGYIECVATREKARGKGVCTALLQHVMQELAYRQLVLEVIDTNTNAYRLYQKVGFVEFERKTEKLQKLKGFKERIYMKWSK